jgi:hypothetical protein
MMKPAALGLAAGLVLGLSGASFANDLLATEQFSGATITFQPQANYANLTLRVTGPNNYHASAAFPGGVASIDLTRYGTVADGPYSYNLTGTAGEVVLASGRDEGRPAKSTSAYELKSLSKSGSFTIKGGAIVSRAAVEPKRR